MFVQSVLFDRRFWSVEGSTHTFSILGFSMPKNKQIHETKLYYRFRVKNPDYKKYFYRTGWLSKKQHVKAIFGFEKKQQGRRGKGIFDIALDYNVTSTNTIKKYALDPIVHMRIRRHPIMSVAKQYLKLITLGRAKIDYDKIMHLSLIITVLHNGVQKDIIIEKNETVNLNDKFEHSDLDEYFTVDLQGKKLNMYELIETCRSKIGPVKFFSYDGFTNNCQMFITELLRCSDLLIPAAYTFINQDLTEIIKNSPKWAHKFANFVTTSASVVSKWLGYGPDPQFYQ